MNDTLAKILKLIFNKTTLAYMVLALIILYGKFWFAKSEYSPKSIKQSVEMNGRQSVVSAQKSLSRDSLIWLKLNQVSHDQYILRLQVDTVIEHQAPQVIQNIKLLKLISDQLKQQERNSSYYVPQPIDPIIKTEPIENKYAEAVSLLDEIELSMAPSDTVKTKKKSL